MNNSDDIKRMLKEHNISIDEYNKARSESKLGQEMYDSLALEYNAPLGITWEELAKRYKAMYPDLELTETLDRALMKWEDGEVEDYQEFSRELEKIIKKIRKKVSPKAGQTYPSPRTDKIVKALFKYWDDDLPLGDNRKTYFQKLADENELSFDRVAQIELQWRPDSFKPKR